MGGWVVITVHYEAKLNTLPSQLRGCFFTIFDSTVPSLPFHYPSRLAFHPFLIPFVHTSTLASSPVSA